jgi:hypothetical protein
MTVTKEDLEKAGVSVWRRKRFDCREEEEI